MAKHPVPKKKMSQAKTASRFASFAGKKHRNLKGFTNVVTCAACGNPTLNQFACSHCGSYRGRSTVDMNKEVSKITKVKA